jgi:hypothetical protein
MTSHVKVCSLTTYHIMLVEFGELPMELYALRLTMSFQQCLAHLPSFCVANQATSLSQHHVEQGAKTWHNLTTMWKASWGLNEIIGATRTIEGSAYWIALVVNWMQTLGSQQEMPKISPITGTRGLPKP